MLAFNHVAGSLTIPSHVRVGSTPNVLSQIREPGVNLVIWERELPDTVAAAIKTHNLKSEELFRTAGRSFSFNEGTNNIARRYPRRNRIRDVLKSQCDAYLECLVDDQTLLAYNYFKLFPEIPSFRFLSRIHCGPAPLDRMTAASHFHLDRDSRPTDSLLFSEMRAKTRAVLLTTYFGESGTEWLPKGTYTEYVHEATSTPCATPIDETRIRRLNPGHVALIWMGYNMHGEKEEDIYHRAPSVSENEVRYLTMFYPHTHEETENYLSYVRTNKCLSPAKPIL